MRKFQKDTISFYACVNLAACGAIAGLAGLSTVASLFLVAAAAIAILTV